MFRQHRLISLFGASLIALSSLAHGADSSDQPGAVPSPAEIKLFMSDQLKMLPKKETALAYKFSKAGAYEPGYEGRVSVEFGAADPKQADGRAIKVDFLSGEHKVELPPIEGGHGNPAILGFLERDVREMKRITGGSTNYYRKLIRLALVDVKEVKTVSMKWGGKDIKVDEITIDPFKNDPARSRYTRFANKIYTFDLSDQVPGGLLSMKTVMREGSNTGPVMIEETLSLLESR